MKITSVVLILGKRLVDSQLTLEGKSRVEALSGAINRFDLNRTVFIFCGGATEGQDLTEAKAMFDYFLGYHQQQVPPHILLEDRSTNTVENLSNAADKLIESQLCQWGQALEVYFVSNDYHLNRVFEIQALMDEQGLLRTLKQRCSQNGLQLTISQQLEDHVYVPYPHHNLLGQIFLLLDELTTYRVYLEGVKNKVFDQPLEQVWSKPNQIASEALAKLKDLMTEPHAVTMLDEIESAIVDSSPSQPQDQAILQLPKLHKNLTRLNRFFDPENN